MKHRLKNKQLSLFAAAPRTSRSSRRAAGKGKTRARLGDAPAVHAYLSAIGRKGAAATNAKRRKTKKKK